MPMDRCKGLYAASHVSWSFTSLEPISLVARVGSPKKLSLEKSITHATSNTPTPYHGRPISHTACFAGCFLLAGGWVLLGGGEEGEAVAAAAAKCEVREAIRVNEVDEVEDEEATVT
mmetsp:Transcript_67453/g.135901  ORF Transcript_67453/g.135901 Transcript_67453/m.135901 type:complete len:117 (-) Transcript_67453:2263-2613(-)